MDMDGLAKRIWYVIAGSAVGLIVMGFVIGLVIGNIIA